MTVLTEAGPRPAVPRRRPRFLRLRLLLVLAAVIVVAAGLVTWQVLRNLDDKYGPVDSGAFASVYNERNWVSIDHGSVLRLSGSAGARAQLLESLVNQGSHSVKVTRVDGDDAAVVEIQWSRYHVRPGGLGTGVAAPWHDFPAIIAAHGTIRILITIHRSPTCRRPQPKGVHWVYGDSYEVHWESLLGSHTTAVQGLNADDDDIQVC